jgi:hypothetical protein
LALCTEGILLLNHFVDYGGERHIFFLDTSRFISDIKAAISDYRGLAKLLSSRWPTDNDVQEMHDVFFQRCDHCGRQRQGPDDSAFLYFEVS